ncbi:MAG: type II secretion system secretin GspD [Beijerinckiaceae bacterium]|nr:type II secretion system secretin GspD [Beijerinckiaceae bacterium]MCZ8298991.1 type II secretion system secretin GspD [Beijerinckiaceae bacterium]
MLNFVNVDIQEFARVAFDEILKESVVIDPSIQGKITVRTPEPVSRRVAVDILRSALETQGLQLAKTGNVYRISGRGGTQGRSQLNSNVRIVPLTSISAEQARAALQPFTNNQVQISATADGRALLLSGAQADVEGLAQVIGALDVDQLRTVSFALIPLKEAGAAAVSQELNQMFGGRDTQAFRAMPIQRINGILITARSRETLTRARTWIQKLDQTGRDSRKVQVYQLQNRRAGEVSQLLQGMFGAPQAQAQGARQPGNRTPLGPGLTPSLTQSFNVGGQQAPQMASIGAPPSSAGEQTSTGGYAEPPVATQGQTQGQDAEPQGAGVSIRADVATNSIVVIAKPDEYRIVESAIRRLDVLPSQVLIEATIVEVGLNDALRHGVRWFLQNGNHAASLTDSPTGSLGAVFPGFNYTFNAGNARLVINALEGITDVEIVSSPALTVLDNQPATLKIGDQVPVATRSARSVTNPDAPIVNDIEMKDTGIILSVTPRVNSSGLVMLDISQEASDVVQTTTSSIDSPTIRQRKINSSVAVQSGSEVVLGGIISRRREKTKQGVPGLMHIPVLGNAFTSLSTKEKERTELMIIIRPTVVNSRQDLQILTQEIKSRMSSATTALYR